MAKRKIIWSNRAQIQLISILSFYAERNGNKRYSLKLFEKINREIKKLADYTDLGFKTDFPNVRGLIVDEYIIYYQVDNSKIDILVIWDSRMNPLGLHFD